MSNSPDLGVDLAAYDRSAQVIVLSQFGQSVLHAKIRSPFGPSGHCVGATGQDTN
jgi:hypothetical protein